MTIAINRGLGAGKTAEMLRQAFEAAQAGEVVQISSREGDVVMMTKRRWLELEAKADRRGSPT